MKLAFTESFKESAEKTIRLPEDKESIVELLVDWVYHQGFKMLPEVLEFEEEEDGDDGKEEEEKSQDRFE